jgi:hypothetical protein
VDATSFDPENNFAFSPNGEGTPKNGCGPQQKEYKEEVEVAFRPDMLFLTKQERYMARLGRFELPTSSSGD